MASAFLRLVVTSAPRGHAIDLHDLPDEMSCVAEESVSEGRTDLSLSDDTRTWHAIVEIKIHAGYGHAQIERYLRSFRTDAERNVLAAITRDVPSYGDFDGDDPNWAGSVQWAKLLPGLRDLQPQNPSLASQWPLFLDVLEKEGSMGFTQPQTDLFWEWSRYKDARKHVMDFVNAVRTPLLEALEDVLGTSAPNGVLVAAVVTRGQSKVAVVPHISKIFVRFRVPATGPERLYAGVYGYGTPRFFVEVPYPRDPVSSAPVASVAAELRRHGFVSWRDQVLSRFLPLDEALVQAGLEEQVLKFAQESFALIADSGVLELKPFGKSPLEDEGTD